MIMLYNNCVVYICSIAIIIIVTGGNNPEEGGGQILLCTSGRGWYQEWGKEAKELHCGDVEMILSLSICRNLFNFLFHINIMKCLTAVKKSSRLPLVSIC